MYNPKYCKRCGCYIPDNMDTCLACGKGDNDCRFISGTFNYEIEHFESQISKQDNDFRCSDCIYYKPENKMCNLFHYGTYPNYKVCSKFKNINPFDNLHPPKIPTKVRC